MYVNKTFCQYLKLPETTTEIKDPNLEAMLEEHVIKDDLADAKNTLNNMESGAESQLHQTIRIRGPDDRIHVFHNRGSTVQMGEDGKPSVITSILFDVTEQEAMKRRLSANEAYARRILEHIPASIYELNSDLKMVYCN